MCRLKVHETCNDAKGEKQIQKGMFLLFMSCVHSRKKQVFENHIDSGAFGKRTVVFSLSAGKT